MSFEDEFSEYQESLKISVRDLETEMSKQASLYSRVVVLYADLKALHDSAKMLMDDMKAKLDISYREELDANGERVTDKKIESLVLADKRFLEAKENYIELGKWVAKFEGLLEAYRQRHYMLCEINRKTSVEMQMSLAHN